MDVTIKQLRMLREIAHAGTISAAAATLDYTPSAVSQQITALEKGAGVQVLEKVGRNVQLTDAGRELVRHADELLFKLEEAQVALEQVEDEARGRFMVATFESVATTILPTLLIALKRDHPGLELHTCQLDPDDAVEMLRSGRIDLAFAIDYPHAPAPPVVGIDRVHLAADPFRMVVSPDDPLADRVRVPVTELRGRPLIADPPASSCHRCLEVACGHAGFEPEIRHELHDYVSTLQLVAAGCGTGMVPELALRGVLPDVRAIEIDPPILRILQLAYRSSSAGRPALRAVVEAAQKVVADLGLAP